MASILIIEDEESLRKSLSVLLRNKGHDVTTVEDGEKALPLLGKCDYDVVLTDLRMKKVTGEEILKKVKECSPATEVVIITAYGTIQSAVEAMKTGAFHYITKPFTTEEIISILDKALAKRRIFEKLKFKEETVRYSSEEIIHASRSMDDIIQLIKKIAPTDITVLIEGESGTGKELLAQAIHKNSLRKEKPFLTVNSSLPETLLESELFGYVKGAFTGALADKKGLFELSDSGTLFLDEIGDTSPALQARLLRAIQEKEIRRVGGEEFTRVDVRLIVASNKNLATLVKDGKFRDDLYYRINVMPICIPPLRERKEGIIPLAEYFIQKYSNLYKKEISGMDEELTQKLLDYNWPGNVRELEHTIERGIALTNSPLLDKTCLLFLPEDEKLWLAELKNPSTLTLKEKEKIEIIKTLKKNKWNYTRTSKELGISRTTLWRRMKEYGLKEEL